MPKPNPKQFAIECRYVGSTPMFKKLSGHWHTLAHYETRRARSEALRALIRKQTCFRYRAKEDKKETKET